MTFSDSRPLESVLEKLDDATTDDSATVNSILNEFGHRSFGPILTLCGIVMLTPLGAIPGVPAILAICITSSALQLIFGRKKPWLPKRIGRLKISSARLVKAKRLFRPFFRFIDGLIRPRMTWAASEGARLSVALISIFLALALLILAALPFGGLIPGFLIALFGVGILARDGLILTICFTTIIGLVSLIFLAT